MKEWTTNISWTVEIRRDEYSKKQQTNVDHLHFWPHQIERMMMMKVGFMSDGWGLREEEGRVCEPVAES